MKHGGGSGAHGGAGIEGMTPPIGPMTSVAGVGAFFAAAWLIFAHPRVAGLCVVMGCVITALVVPSMGLAVNSPITFLVCLVAACAVAGESAPTKRAQRKIDAHNRAVAAVRVRTTDPMIQLRKDYLK